MAADRCFVHWLLWPLLRLWQLLVLLLWLLRPLLLACLLPGWTSFLFFPPISVPSHFNCLGSPLE